MSAGKRSVFMKSPEGICDGGSSFRELRDVGYQWTFHHSMAFGWRRADVGLGLSEVQL